ncbi:hypothetical protein GCM10025785_05220 [Corynebacterium canis]
MHNDNWLNEMNTLRKILRFTTLLVVIVNVCLAYFHFIEPRQAVLITVGLEFLLALIFIFFAGEGIRRYRQARSEGLSFSESLLRFAAEVVPGPVMKLAKHELDMWKLLGFWLRRKINAPADAVTFKYGTEQRAIFIVLILVSIVEIVVIDLIVPWQTVRTIIVVVSIYGAIWLFLFFKSFRINPHYIDDRELVLRVGLLAELVIGLQHVKQVRAAHKTWGNKFLSIEAGRAVIKHGSDTNIEIVLREPVSGIAKDNAEPVDHVYCAVDNPQEFVEICKGKILDG